MNTPALTNDEKNWAIGAHLSAFSGVVIPLGSLLGPMVVWMIKKNESEFVNEHGKAALNFQISFFIYTLIFVGGLIVNLFKLIPQLSVLENNADPTQVFSILGSWMIWILPLIIISLFKLIVIIIAAIKAGDGKSYTYPLTISFIN